MFLFLFFSISRNFYRPVAQQAHDNRLHVGTEVTGNKQHLCIMVRSHTPTHEGSYSSLGSKSLARSAKILPLEWPHLPEPHHTLHTRALRRAKGESRNCYHINYTRCSKLCYNPQVVVLL